jgi:hypothetical protein
MTTSSVFFEATGMTCSVAVGGSGVIVASGVNVACGEQLRNKRNMKQKMVIGAARRENDFSMENAA